MTLEKLKDASCSDGDCVFKITPEMKKGMRTNGGCSCLKDMRHGIGSRKTYAVMVLSQIASDAEAALKEKDEEIKSLKLLLSDCLDCFEHTTTRPIAVAIKKALEARTTKHIVEPSPLTPEELAEYEQECREEAQDDFC